MTETSAITGSATFRHGVHPAERKEATEASPVERMPFVDEYVLHLSQHLGAPSRPVVAVGQRVERGEMVAGPGGFISTALHAPVTGVVSAIFQSQLGPDRKMIAGIRLLRRAGRDFGKPPGKYVIGGSGVDPELGYRGARTCRNSYEPDG